MFLLLGGLDTSVGWLVYVSASLNVFRDVVLLAVLVVGFQVLLFFLFKFLLNFPLLLLLIFVKGVDKQVDVLKVVNAQTLANGINLNFELVLLAGSQALFSRLIVNEVIGLFNEQFENIFDALVLVLNVVLDASHNRLVLLELAAAHALILAVHDRSVLVHLGLPLRLGFCTLVA